MVFILLLKVGGAGCFRCSSVVGQDQPDDAVHGLKIRQAVEGCFRHEALIEGEDETGECSGLLR
ncbi:hypothetical protein [Pannonibacter phragmitetus]|uniref:hypothetical protein n=1 Tax=Pannonibacter phragmitetus TaxID=121719 RepID=UPI003D2EBFEA